MSMGGNIWTVLLASLALVTVAGAPAFAQQQKPNILVIMADDIGYWNISAYNRGMMGYRTPNIDRIANEGAIFTDYYGQQSCTAGRAAFITGQSPMRTGLLKVGLPGAKEGLSEKDPTLADLLKPLGYVSGQFGKNHLGDRNEFLPTVHGFDEFVGNLYHLNAEDEPEHADYPKNTEFKLRFGPRGVLRCTATTVEVPGEDARWGKWGKQNCEDTGPLDKKRMETVDDEFLTATLDFIDQANRLLVAGFWFQRLGRVDRKSKLGGTRRYDGDFEIGCAMNFDFAVDWACGNLAQSAHHEKASAGRLTLAEMPQVDHRIGQRFECIVQLAEAIETKQQVAELIFPAEHTLDRVEPLFENGGVEKRFAASLESFSTAGIRVDIGNHPAIENGFAVSPAIVNAIQADDGSVKVNANSMGDARHQRQGFSQ